MLNTYNEIKAWVLKQCLELSDGTSDFSLSAEIDMAMVDIWRDIVDRHPWLCLTKSPPGALLVVAPITTLSLTIAQGTGVTGTLSATYVDSLTGRKIQPVGSNYYVRITAHTAGTDQVTVDVAPDTLTAVSVIIYQDEYDLASDVNVLHNGLWTRYGAQIELWPEERLRNEYPGPTSSSAWPAEAFARIGVTRIRLSTYSPTVERLEYPYTRTPVDPDTAPDADLALESALRTVYALGVMATMFTRKSDGRAAGKRKDYEDGIEASWIKDRDQLRTIQGQESHRTRPGDYQ